MARGLTWTGGSPGSPGGAAGAGGLVVRVGAGAGSGVDGSCGSVRRLLADPDVAAVVIGHRDRLGRMSTELAEAAFWVHGRRLVVPGGGAGDDLAGDMAGVLTWFCACLYGRGPARNRVLRAAGLRPAGHRAAGGVRWKCRSRGAGWWRGVMTGEEA